MKDSIGLEIGSAGVRAARVSLSGQPALEDFHQVLLPSGAVAEGEIVDASPVEKAIAKAASKVGKSKRVTVAVANQKVVARVAELPFIQEKDLAGAIRYQVADLIPIPLDSAVLDYQVLGEFTNEDEERMNRVLVVAAHKDMINSYFETIEKAGVSLEAIDFTPLAIMRSLGLPGEPGLGADHDGEALIDVGTEVTSMVVRYKQMPKLARVLAVGGSEEPEMLVDELRGSIKFYMGQSDEGAISRAILSGEAGNLHVVAPLLSDALNIPVMVGSCLGSLKASKKTTQRLQVDNAEPVFAAAVGAALGALEA